MMNPTDRFAELQAEDAADDGGKVRIIVYAVLARSKDPQNIVSDTEELVQEVWLRCWTSLAGGEDVDSHWLHVVARNTASQLRTSTQNWAKKIPFSVDDPVESGEEGDFSDFLDTYIQPKDQQREDPGHSEIDEALLGMPEDTAEIVREFYIDTMSIRQIAERHMITVSAAGKRLQRARDAIRTKLGVKKSGIIAA